MSPSRPDHDRRRLHDLAVRLLGGAPQYLSYEGEPTKLEIGSGCTIRECVTMNAGTIKGGGMTRSATAAIS